MVQPLAFILETVAEEGSKNLRTAEEYVEVSLTAAIVLLREGFSLIATAGSVVIAEAPDAEAPDAETSTTAAAHDNIEGFEVSSPTSLSFEGLLLLLYIKKKLMSHK